MATFNVLNFSNTVAGCTGGVSSAAMACRGARSAISGAANPAAQCTTKFPRQRAKTVATIVKMHVAVVGLSEIESDGDGARSAQQALMDALTLSTSPGRYALVDVDTGTGQATLPAPAPSLRQHTVHLLARATACRNAKHRHRWPPARPVWPGCSGGRTDKGGVLAAAAE